MKTLWDGDILLYEVGFAAEASWKHKLAELNREVTSPPPFDLVEETLEQRIASVLGILESEEEPTFFFTGKTNFRNDIAFTRPYKDRVGNKPYHYRNIKAYLFGTRDCRQVEGFEADDLIAIELVKDNESICVSRDKDLRQVPGWHYSWELGNQPSFGPHYNKDYGWIRLSDKRNKLIGMGDKFFFSQMLTGDDVDTIPGIPKMGAVGAFKLLEATSTYEEGLEAVKGAYKASYGLWWPEVMHEQGQLLRMVTETNEDGSPVLWRFEYK